MFKKDSKNRKSVNTIISPMTVIEGTIRHPKSLRIDGKIIGEIHCDGDVFIGKSGCAEPFVYVKNIIIAGAFKGEINASGKVHIMPSGKVTGTVTSKGIIIDEGGIFNGQSTVETENEPIKKEA